MRRGADEGKPGSLARPRRCMSARSRGRARCPVVSGTSACRSSGNHPLLHPLQDNTNPRLAFVSDRGDSSGPAEVMMSSGRFVALMGVWVVWLGVVMMLAKCVKP